MSLDEKLELLRRLRAGQIVARTPARPFVQAVPPAD
jgi:hypothetical protein